VSVLVSLSVPVADFLFGDALSTPATERITLERVVPMGGRCVPYVRVSGPDPDRIVDEVSASASVESLGVLERTETDALVRVTWANDDDDLLGALSDPNVTVLETSATDGRWTLTLRFVDHDALSGFHHRCREAALDLEIDRISHPSGGTIGADRFDLTEAQRETLVRAFEVGYFDIPRRSTLEGLADRLGVSDTAASQRLRRGMSSLVEHALVEADDSIGG
jgi:predicted DNA binding protein